MYTKSLVKFVYLILCNCGSSMQLHPRKLGDEKQQPGNRDLCSQCEYQKMQGCSPGFVNYFLSPGLCLSVAADQLNLTRKVQVHVLS